MQQPTLPKRVLARLDTIPTESLAHGLPYLRSGKPAFRYIALRKATYDKSGYDLLARAELMRPPTYVSPLEMIGARSRHLCGDCFDLDRDDKNIFVEQENINGQYFWRIFVRVLRERGGFHMRVTNRMGETDTLRVMDFTELAQEHDFIRVPAYRGWEARGPQSQRMLWWHYQLDDNLTFDECVSFLYGQHTQSRPMRLALNERVFGLGDRSKEVRNLQTMLSTLDRLPETEVDGVFGLPTRDAVRQFQIDKGIITKLDDKRAGIADPRTRRQIIDEVLAIATPTKKAPQP
jgi:hypothetical protein